LHRKYLHGGVCCRAAASYHYIDESSAQRLGFDAGNSVGGVHICLCISEGGATIVRFEIFSRIVRGCILPCDHISGQLLV
jgi:hypothetical protein